jgi:chloride channel protein, CIC family
MIGLGSHTRLDPRQLGRALLLFAVVGLVAGLAAVLFARMVRGAEVWLLEPVLGGASPARSLSELRLPTGAGWLILVLPTLGGFIVGQICSRYCPEAMGAGVGTVIDAYHRRGGLIRRRVPFVKAVCSAVTIGTGGSAGTEGPIGQISAGLGAWISRLLKLSRGERQIVVMAGFAAGIGAIFGAPMAAAIFAAEVLYRDADMEHEVLVPSIIAATVAYAVFGTVEGEGWGFAVPDIAFEPGLQLVPYLLLGVVMAAAARGFIVFFTTLQSRWGFSPRIRLWLRPTLGGLGVGIIGLVLPLALGRGTEMAQLTLGGELSLGLLLVLAFAKMTTTTLTAGMGGSGGLFFPSLLIGGALGAAVGTATAELIPALGIQTAGFAVVGMAGFFAAVSNAPLSTVIMVAEIVGSYTLVVPALWVCTVAWLLNRGNGVYRQQVDTRLDAPSRLSDMMGAVLQKIPVSEAATLDRSRLVTVTPGASLREMVQLFADSTQAVFPIVGPDGRLRGVVDGQLVRRTLGEAGFDDLLIADDFLSDAVTVTPDDSLHDAITKMTAWGHDYLVVVSKQARGELVGLLSRRQIVTAYHRRMLEVVPPPTGVHEVIAGAEEALDEEPNSLAAALARGGLVTGLEAESPNDALAKLVAGARLPPVLDRARLIARLCEREELSSTGVGDGVAIPHPHARDLEVDPPWVVLGLLARPVPWNAYDGVPVDVVFLLLASSGERHLQLLSRLARSVADSGLRELLRQGASMPAILRRVRELEEELTQRRTWTVPST